MDFFKIGDLIIEFSSRSKLWTEATVGSNFLLKIVGAESFIVFDFLKLSTLNFCYREDT